MMVLYYGKILLSSFLCFLLIGCGCGGGHRWDGEYQHEQFILSGSLDEDETVLSSLDERSSLDDYLVVAALNNPGLKADFYRFKASFEAIEQVRTLPDPQLTYQYFIQEVETRVGAQRQGFGLSQKFPWFGKLDLQSDIAAQAAQSQYQRWQGARLKLYQQVKDAWYEYYYLGKAIAVTSENIQLVQHLETVARSRFKTGTGAHAGVIRAQVELGKLEDRLRSLQEQKAPLIARLNAALNREVSCEVTLPDTIEQGEVEVDSEQLMNWLNETNPALKAMDYAILGHKRQIELSEKNYYPDITVGITTIDTAKARGGMSPSDNGKNPIVAMVSVNLPIWKGKYDAGVRQSRQNYQSVVHDKVNMANTLRSELRLELYHLQDARRKNNLYRQGLLPKAQESLKVAEADYQGGRGNFSDLIDAQRIHLEFSLEAERAIVNYAQSVAKLEMLVGRELPVKAE
ncbi:MAG: TolC family protein [Phycisphaerae bacterium]|nr:TolC family protein [Phycisphaerae bacterium]